MRKPAKLKSAKEALTKMLDGVVFFYCDSRIYWDEEEIQFCVSYDDGREKEKLYAFLENYADWDLEQQWWQSIPSGGVLCQHKTEENKYYVITHADPNGYMGYHKLNGKVIATVYIDSCTPVPRDILNEWIENAPE